MENGRGGRGIGRIAPLYSRGRGHCPPPVPRVTGLPHPDGERRPQVSRAVRAQAPAARAAAAYAHSRAKISHGDSACASGLTAVIALAMGCGMKFCDVSWTEALNGANSS